MRKLMMTAVAATVAATMGAYAEEKAADDSAMKVSVTPEATYLSVDKDKDGNVTVTELQAYFVEWFKKTDKNGDGKITPDEMEANAANSFKNADLNGDGILVVEEIVTYRAGKDVKAGNASIDAKGRHTFARSDADKNGKVSSVEYAVFWTDLHGKMDADKDAKVTAEEYKQQANKWFKAMDANNDGAVTCEEMMKAQTGDAACAVDQNGGCCGMSAKPDAEKKDVKPAPAAK